MHSTLIEVNAINSVLHNIFIKDSYRLMNAMYQALKNTTKFRRIGMQEES